jgi:hypothetical protein
VLVVANGRNKNRKGHDTSRDPGGFVALPWTVIDCPAYALLSHPARSLLWEFARQYVRDNNGRLLASGAYLAKRGWKSSDVIVRAKRELQEAGFIHETVMGHRPNKASWYAVTWRSLDKIPGYDPGATETFKRGAYQQSTPLKNTSLTPAHGVMKTSIAPPRGVGRVPSTPSYGAISALLPTPSTPSRGNHLDMPSIAVGIGDVLATMPPDTKTALLANSHPSADRDSMVATHGRDYYPADGHGPCRRLTVKPRILFTDLLH